MARALRHRQVEVIHMCLNCGCGLPEERHKAGDITLSDLKKAAANHDMSVEAAAENMTAAMGDLKKAGRI